MADNESTMRWKVDIAQLTSAMQEAKRSISMANAEFKSATSGLKKWADTATGVEAKIKQLNSTSEGQKKVLASLKEQYAILAKQFGENSTECEKLRIKITNQEATVGKTERQLKEYKDRLIEIKKAEQEAQSPLAQLNNKISEQENKLSGLKKEYQNAVLTFGKNSQEVKTLAKEIGALSSELNENKAKLKSTADNADKLDKSLDKIDGSAKNAGNGGFTILKGAMANLVSQGINVLVSGLTNLAKEMINVGMDFESSMSKVGAVSGANTKELEQLTDKAKEMGEKTVFSASQSAEAFNYMAMAGWDTEQMLNGIDGVMNLAAASGADLATTSDIVTDALTAMGYSAEDAGHLADVMASASSNANTNVEMMGQTFQYAAPIVGALGYSMEDTALAIGLMANAGIKGEKAGTALRSTLTRLSAPPTECASALEELGVSITNADGSMRPFRDVLTDLRGSFSGLNETQQTNIAKSIAGQEAMSGLLAIVNASDEDFNKLAQAVDYSNGSAERMAKTMTNNVQGSLTLLKSQIEGKMIKVFEKLSPVIQDGVKSFSKFIDGLDWDKIAKSLGNLAKTLMNLAKFLLENASAIAKFIIAFMAIKTVVNITKNLSSAYQMLTPILGKAKTAMGLFTGATKLSSLSISSMVGGVGLLIAGVSALIGFMVRQRQKMIEAREATYKATEEYKRNAAALENMDNMVENVTNDLDIFKNASDDIAHIEFNAESAKSLADEIFALSDKSNKSKDEIILLNAKVQEFNSLGLDGVQIEFDETGQKVKGTREEIEELIETSKRTAEMVAINGLIRESTEKVLRANSDLAQAEKDRLEIQKDLNKKLQEQAELQEKVNNTASQGSEKGHELNEEYKENKQQLEQLNTEIGMLQQQESDATQKIGEATNAVQEAKQKQSEWTEVMKIANEEGVSVLEAQEKLQQKYSETAQSLDTSTLDSAKSFDEYVYNANKMAQGVGGEMTAMSKMAQNKINEIAQKVRDGKLSEGDGRNAIRSYVDGFKNQMDTLVGATDNFITRIARKAINNISVKINGESVGQHAEGGIFNKPTLGIIGEDGGEVVMPLQKHTEWIGILANQLLSRMGGATTINRTTSSSNTQNVVFNQTINSPKAVDRYEVYKDTNNLLFNAKVGLSHV